MEGHLEKEVRARNGHNALCIYAKVSKPKLKRKKIIQKT